jgi:uncharacterized protein (TIGR02246 family)
MRRLRAVWIAVGLLCPGLGAAQPSANGCLASEAARALCAAESDLTSALRRNDASALAQFYAEEFQLVNYRGRKIGKADVLAAIRTGTLRFDSLSTSDLEVRVYGNVGVISGVQHQVAREPGNNDQAHPKDVRFTHLYVARTGRWLLVSSQITPIQGQIPHDQKGVGHLTGVAAGGGVMVCAEALASLVSTAQSC